ncbi:RFX [Candida theae]|uniref:RFX n=1 Tax=Candida theae TaxID=1198502 RepID=A0AAD5BFQ3_9ASCO|nr:RFX [Candida theae]KAI5958903.1 RFX [Candida theae]
MNPEQLSSHQKSVQIRLQKEQQQRQQQLQQQQQQHALSHNFPGSDHDPQYSQYQQPTNFASFQAQPEYLPEQLSEQPYTLPINPSNAQSQRLPSSSQSLGQPPFFGGYSQPAYLTQESVNLSMPSSQHTSYRSAGQYSNPAFQSSDQSSYGSSSQFSQSSQLQLQRMEQGEQIQQTTHMPLQFPARYEPSVGQSSTIPTIEPHQQTQYGQTTTASSSLLRKQDNPVLQPDLLQEETTKSKPPAHLRRHRRNNSSISSVLHSTAYEEELKKMAMAKVSMPLPEIARRIKQQEFDTTAPLTSHSAATSEGSSSSPLSSSQSSALEKAQNSKETQRSVFGMVWLLTACEVSPTAVIPRTRIYARYVQICADNSLSPLSPASFGKLVRILYPTITTRRLGMRGQSKYHYCGIRLKGEQSMQQQLMQRQQLQQNQFLRRGVQASESQVSGEGNWQSRLQSPARLGISSASVEQSPLSTRSSVSYEESPQSAFGTNTPTYSPINSPSVLASASNIGDQLPSVSHLQYVPGLFKLLGMESVAPKSYPFTTIELPSIYSYLPQDTDRDVADTLASLYKVHVNTVFESLRFMQLKRLFSCFNNFNSILSTSVSKLYAAEPVLEWVQKCDLLMYKKMIRMLSKLHMQYMMPQDNLNQLKTIASTYTRTLTNSIVHSQNSKSFISMKLKMAKRFVSILNRLIKVIDTGSTASRILNDDNEKQAMLEDWQKLDLADLVSRDVPCTSEANLNTLIFILKEEVVKMLEMTLETEGGSLMQSYADFISALPSRLPGINPRMFLLLSSNLLTSILREISLNSGDGFGAWWVVRCWLDEYLAWIMEVGGFFEDELRGYTEEPRQSVAESSKSEEIFSVPPVGESGAQEEEEYTLSGETSIDLLG